MLFVKLLTGQTRPPCKGEHGSYPRGRVGGGRGSTRLPRRDSTFLQSANTWEGEIWYC